MQDIKTPAKPAGRGKARPRRTDRPVDLRGHVDAAEPGRIRGWAFDPEEPGRALEIDLYEGDRHLARVVAGEYRRDLEAAGIGTGRYGFSFSFSPQLFPLARHVLSVRFAQNGHDLRNSPITLSNPSRDVAADLDDIGALIDTRLRVLADADEAGRMIDMLLLRLEAALGARAGLGKPWLPERRPDPAGSAPVPRLADLIATLLERHPKPVLPVSRSPELSVVLTVRNGFATLHAALKALADAPPAVPFEVIVVDDQSDDEMLLARALLDANVRVFRTAAPLGRVKARKAGLALATGRWVLFLDQRARVLPGAIDALVATAKRDPAIAMACGRVMRPSGTLAAIGARIGAAGDLVPAFWNASPGDSAIWHMRDTDVATGAAVLVDKVLWGRVGGYPDLYGGEPHADADFAMRVRKAGRRVVVQPQAGFELGMDHDTLVPGAGFQERSAAAADARVFADAWSAEIAALPPPGRNGDRSGRPLALFIDHSYPRQSQDAGSAAALSHMQALQRLGWSVAFVPGGPTGADERDVRALQALGVECFHAPAVTSAAQVLETLGPSLGLVYLHRLSNADAYLDEARRVAPQARLLFSVADLHHLRLRREADLRGDAALAAEAEALRVKEMSLIGRANSVITHSPIEAGLILAEHGDADVHVVPWAVEARPVGPAFEERFGIAFIGGADHAPNRDAAVYLAREVMPRVHRVDPSITCLLVGAGMVAGDAELAGPGIRPVGFVPDLHAGVLSRVRLTVAPLRFGAGVKGKVLASLAAGVPCVMTPVAAEGLPDVPGLAAFVADGADALADAIVAVHSGVGVSAEAMAAIAGAVAAATSPAAVASALADAVRGREAALRTAAE